MTRPDDSPRQAQSPRQVQSPRQAVVGVLLPVRIETRFSPGRLRVRVIPDEPWFNRHDPCVSVGELDALRRYVAALAAATTDPAREVAWRELVAQAGGARAVHLIRVFVVAGPNGEPVVRDAGPDEVREEPAFPRIEGFPDRLDVWLARGGGSPESVLTLTVDRDRLLADFPDPDEPTDRRWWEDWDEACAAGLAGEIELGGDPDDIDALFVTGLGDGDPAKLFAAHGDAGRLATIAPGTATNTVDGQPAAPLGNDPDTWWDVLHTPASDTERLVSAALTGDPGLLGNLPGPAEPHREPSAAIVAALLVEQARRPLAAERRQPAAGQGPDGPARRPRPGNPRPAPRRPAPRRRKARRAARASGHLVTEGRQDVALIVDAVHRLEADPVQTDLARGFRAEVADPVWLLGRQWQLGEHAGEDASSPVRLRYQARLTPIDPVDGQPNLDPRTTPAEAIVEAEPGDSWTPARRVAAGRAVAAPAAAAGIALDDPHLLLADLPAPYDLLDGTGLDGRTLWRRRVELGLDEGWFGVLRPPDPEPADLWDPAELSYHARFRADGVDLTLDRHDGGDLDWYSVDADAPLPPPGAGVPVRELELFPGRLRFPGAPVPRWWQIEDGRVDIGGYPPDRAHLSTLLLIDLIVNRSDDWFAFPVDAVVGHVLTLDKVVVVDSFGDEWTLEPTKDWSLFRTHGLDHGSLVVWAGAATPLAGPVLDEVAIGTDEDANLVWAVERRLRGRDVPADADPPATPPARIDAAGRPGFAYRPMTRVPPRWHPYVIEEVAGRRRFVQGRAADLSGPTAALLPEAESDLLIDPASGGVHPTHQLEPAAIGSAGVRVERRAMLARATDGSPVLWTQRRRLPLLTPPGLRLRFDTLDPVPPIPFPSSPAG